MLLQGWICGTTLFLDLQRLHLVNKLPLFLSALQDSS